MVGCGQVEFHEQPPQESESDNFDINVNEYRNDLILLGNLKLKQNFGAG